MGPPEVVQFVICTNIAYDPNRRLMALGLFSTLATENLPWDFPMPPYMIIGVKNVPVGPHVLTVEALTDSKIEMEPPTVEATEGHLLAVLQLRKWTINHYGEVRFRVLMDGNQLHPGSLVCFKAP